MGIYVLSAEEIEEAFEEFLSSQEGEIHKDVLIEAWNKLSKREGWNEEIKEVSKDEE